MTAELTKLARANSGKGTCQVACKGCGCKGGPGFRDKDRKCVGWAEVISKCGPPPHKGCTAECMPVRPGCEDKGRSWFKALSESAGLKLEFVDSEVPAEERKE